MEIAAMPKTPRKRKVIAFIITIVTVFSMISPIVLINAHSVQSVGEVQVANLQRGIIGFEGEYALSDDDSLVTVIVVFEDNPAGVQVFEAQSRGDVLDLAFAENIVEGAHEDFRDELMELFSDDEEGYTINFQYRRALNGASITLPSNMVEYIAEFDSVSSIHPNRNVHLTPPEADNMDQHRMYRYGMAVGRANMRADDMHALGYRGAGVVVAVLDTGVYYHHPAFKGAFLTLDEIHQRNADITEDDTIDGIFYGRNFYDDAPSNDPMETTPEMGFGATEHGTHVAGTILGRNTGGIISILGVAPEAKMFAYRVLGPSGNGKTDIILAGMEQSTHDKPDIVNMSLGMSHNSPVDLISVAVNNIMISFEDMVFVVPSGNDGPRLYTIGSPGSATLAITVASADVSLDGGRERISWFSSRGPVSHSFEIKPDITAHGSLVFSAVPPWSPLIKVEWAVPDDKYAASYGYEQGTSMAAPHISGAVALLIEYSRANFGASWNPATLKNRLMNTAVLFEGSYSVFDTGAGYADVYAAARADTVVSVNYDRVAAQSGVPFEQQDFVTAITASFSFGGYLMIPDTRRAFKNTLSARIANHGNYAHTYKIDYRFINNPGNAASLSFSKRDMRVESGAEAVFSVDLSLNRYAAKGFYEGFIYVTGYRGLVAALPFAFVIELLTPPIIGTSMLPRGEVGVPYETEIIAWSNAPAYTNWSIDTDGGSLPPGLIFNPEKLWEVTASDTIESTVLETASVMIRGTPTESGSFTFTVRAENEAGYDARDLTIVIR